MTISQLISKLGKTVNDNSPLILTGIGVAGTISTAVLAGRASFKAARILDDDYTDNGPSTFGQKLRLVWPLYIPTVSTGALTITAVLMGNHIGTRRAAAMAAAYTISQESFQEYRTKIIEKMGENKERQAYDEIAQDHINRNPYSSASVVVTGNGEVDFMDDYSGRYFQSTMEDVKHAINKINNRINHQVYASLNDLYNELGLDNVPLGEELGWTNQLVEPVFTTGVTNTNRPCFVIRFQVEPQRGYFKAHF